MKLFKQPLALKQKPLTPLLLTFKIVQLHEDSLTTNGREWTRRNVFVSHPLVSIRGSFFFPSGWAIPRRDFCSADIQDPLIAPALFKTERMRIAVMFLMVWRPLVSTRFPFMTLFGS